MLHLQKCEQHITSFSYRVEVKVIISVRKNYTIVQRTVVSVWAHEGLQTEKTINQVRDDYQNLFRQESPQNRHYCDESMNSLQQTM